MADYTALFIERHSISGQCYNLNEYNVFICYGNLIPSQKMGNCQTAGGSNSPINQKDLEICSEQLA